MPVGLKALPLKVHLQFRGFLHLGDTINPTFHIVHMHTILAGAGDNVKQHSDAFRFYWRKTRNIISFYFAIKGRSCGAALTWQDMPNPVICNARIAFVFPPFDCRLNRLNRLNRLRGLKVPTVYSLSHCSVSGLNASLKAVTSSFKPTSYPSFKPKFISILIDRSELRLFPPILRASRSVSSSSRSTGTIALIRPILSASAGHPQFGR